jgi:hypothetical protein
MSHNLRVAFIPVDEIYEPHVLPDRNGLWRNYEAASRTDVYGSSLNSGGPSVLYPSNCNRRSRIYSRTKSNMLTFIGSHSCSDEGRSKKDGVSAGLPVGWQSIESYAYCGRVLHFCGPPGYGFNQT